MHNTACATKHDRSPRQWDADERVTLSRAARVAPGDVSPNCIWRRRRRGVRARTDERVRLEHVRVGGKLYTTPRWIEEFGRRLAEADAAYFGAPHGERVVEPADAPAARSPSSSSADGSGKRGASGSRRRGTRRGGAVMAQSHSHGRHNASDAPLVRLGQGAYTRELHARDLDRPVSAQDRPLDLKFRIREPAAVYHAKAKDHLSSHALADFRRCPLLFRKKELGLIADRDSAVTCPLQTGP